jgi:hypothetical protein
MDIPAAEIHPGNLYRLIIVDHRLVEQVLSGGTQRQV